MKKPSGKLDELVRRLQQNCGDNLRSVVLYGSAARGDFDEQYSDVNVLAVFRELSSGALTRIAPVVHWWTHEEKFTPPLMMTADELHESADVFAIELLDIQRAHQILHGDDLVSTLEVPMNLHRVEVEHELRSTLLRLRQHILLRPGQVDELKTVAVKSITSVLTLLRHALIALGEAPPHARAKLLEHSGEVFGFDARPLQTLLDLRGNPQQPVNITDVYGGYMSCIARVAHELDARVPKRHWQKVSGER